jgi:hypothetical protein
MNRPPYQTVPIPIRDDLAAAHGRAWQHIARPGTWWRGDQRVAIAAEARNALGCDLCGRRKAALSPYGVEGAHDELGALPPPVVEAVHRIRTDPARLTERWFNVVIAADIAEEHYVETVSVVAHVVAVDTFARAIGTAPLPLPEPVDGNATRRRPRGAKKAAAWVAWIEPEDLTDDEAAIYPRGRPPANIHRAMSLVPDEVRSFFDLGEHQYLGGLAMRDFGREYRAITHTQIELLAGRVSALNQCFY